MHYLEHNKSLKHKFFKGLSTGLTTLFIIFQLLLALIMLKLNVLRLTHYTIQSQLLSSKWNWKIS